MVVPRDGGLVSAPGLQRFEGVRQAVVDAGRVPSVTVSVTVDPPR